MTDSASARELVEKSFTYVTSLSRECRKAVTVSFEQKHKGLSFSQAEPTLRMEVETWFEERDKNIRIHHEKTSTVRPGEIVLTFAGSNKDSHFKFNVDGAFTLAGSSADPLSYLKTLNFYVDKRDFTK